MFLAFACTWNSLLVSSSLMDLKKVFPQAAKTLLEMNVDDERNHDLALGYAASSIGADEKSEAEADSCLTKFWEDHPDHTICETNGIERKHLLCYPPNVPIPW